MRCQKEKLSEREREKGREEEGEESTRVCTYSYLFMLVYKLKDFKLTVRLCSSFLRPLQSKKHPTGSSSNRISQLEALLLTAHAAGCRAAVAATIDTHPFKLRDLVLQPLNQGQCSHQNAGLVALCVRQIQCDLRLELLHQVACRGV